LQSKRSAAGEAKAPAEPMSATGETAPFEEEEVPQVEAPSASWRTKGVRVKNAKLAVPSMGSGNKALEVVQSERPSDAEAVESVPAEATPEEPKRVFDQVTMLKFSKSVDAHIDLGYQTAPREEPGQQTSVRAEPLLSWRRDMQKVQSAKKKNQADEAASSQKSKNVLQRSDNAWTRQKAAAREAELSREVRSLLNKISPDNKQKIIDQLIEKATQLKTPEEMAVVIGVVFDKVTFDPFFCETYVGMIRELNAAHPAFPAEEDGAAPCSFKRLLLDTCQNKFEDLMNSVDTPVCKEAASDPEALEELLQKQKKAALATMKFIGHLYNSQLLVFKVIQSIVKELIDGVPAELKVEYALELMQAVGPHLEKKEREKAELVVIMDRLLSLKKQKREDGKPNLSSRVKFRIDDLADLRACGWVKKDSKDAVLFVRPA